MEAAMKAVYVGVILDAEATEVAPSATEALLRWWEAEVGELLPKHIAHHMTIRFRPTEAELAELVLGQATALRVVGFAHDAGIQAVVVELAGDRRSANAVPHVTLATDGVTPPVRANDLLSAGFTPVDGPVLTGRVGIFDGKTDVFSR
jgi:hypothetical protein